MQSRTTKAFKRSFARQQFACLDEEHHALALDLRIQLEGALRDPFRRLRRGYGIERKVFKKQSATAIS